MAINRLMGYQCARYEAYLTPSVMLEDLEKGLPVQASMRFTGISGHYVSVVGVTDEMKWIINDPYRDWLHNGPCGFNVLYTQKDWSDHAKGYGIRYSRRVVEREAA
jgi:hypothetical protein